MKFLLTLCLLISLGISYAQTNSNHVWVNGYTRSDGTYVKGHYRTAPNSTVNDNFSTQGNYNPYTGKAGWVPRDNGPTYNSNSYSSGSYSSYSSPKYEGHYNSKGQKVIQYDNGTEIFGLSTRYWESHSLEKEYTWYTKYDGVKTTKGYSKGTLLHGEYSFYYSNGKAAKVSNYYHGLIHGYVKSYNTSGGLLTKAHYEYGVMDYFEHINDEGLLEIWEGPIGDIGSTRKTYYASNSIKSYLKIMPNNKFAQKQYFKNGNIEAEFTTKGGLYYFVDNYKLYNEQGYKIFEGRYFENCKTGIWIAYKEDGSYDFSARFKVYTELHYNGNVKLRGSYYWDAITEEWVKDGLWITYSYDGETMTKFENYSFGKLEKVTNL